MCLAERLDGEEHFLVLLRHISQNGLGAFVHGLEARDWERLSYDITNRVGFRKDSVHKVVSDMSLSADRRSREGAVLLKWTLIISN